MFYCWKCLFSQFSTFFFPTCQNSQNNKVDQVHLTSGDWQIDDDLFKIDVNKKLLYFVATKQSVLESHLYVVSFDRNDTKQFGQVIR